MFLPRLGITNLHGQGPRKKTRRSGLQDQTSAARQSKIRMIYVCRLRMLESECHFDIRYPNRLGRSDRRRKRDYSYPGKL